MFVEVLSDSVKPFFRLRLILIVAARRALLEQSFARNQQCPQKTRNSRVASRVPVLLSFKFLAVLSCNHSLAHQGRGNGVGRGRGVGGGLGVGVGVGVGVAVGVGVGVAGVGVGVGVACGQSNISIVCSGVTPSTS